MALQAQHLEHRLDDGGGKPDGMTPIELSDIAVGDGGFGLNGEAAHATPGTRWRGRGRQRRRPRRSAHRRSRRRPQRQQLRGQLRGVRQDDGTSAVELSAVAGGHAAVLSSTAPPRWTRRASRWRGRGTSTATASPTCSSALPCRPNGDTPAPATWCSARAAPARGVVGSGRRQGGFVLNGDAAYDQAGDGGGGAGDVNGDGLADLIVGAPWPTERQRTPAAPT